jgi:hypothetical protein
LGGSYVPAIFWLWQWVTVWPLADLQLITLGQLTQSLLPPEIKVHQVAD